LGVSILNIISQRVLVISAFLTAKWQLVGSFTNYYPLLPCQLADLHKSTASGERSEQAANERQHEFTGRLLIESENVERLSFLTGSYKNVILGFVTLTEM